jgi:hypothetical protein
LFKRKIKEQNKTEPTPSELNDNLSHGDRLAA